MKHIASILAIGLLISAAIPAHSGQISGPSRPSDILPSDGFAFSFWGPDEGLPSADTWPIIQDRTGYVWIGTGFGVVRFDGMTFAPFNSKNTPAFHGQQVLAIHEDARGRIWVGMLSGGLAIYDHGRFSTPAFADSLIYQTVDGIFADSSGTTYVCSSNGVYAVRKDSATLLTTLPEKPRWGFTHTDGTVYFAGVSLVRYDPATGSSTIVIPGTGEIHAITDVVLNEKKQLFTVRLGEIRRYARRTADVLTFEASFLTPGALKMIRDGEQGFFVGTIGHGAIYFDGTHFLHPQGLGVQRGAGRQVHSLLRGREGGIWATTSGGVYRFSRTFFTVLGTEAGFTYDYSWLVHLQHQKTLWIGLGSDGTYRYDGETISLLKMKDGMPDDHVTDMFESADGRMWFGGANGGLSSYSAGRFRQYPLIPTAGSGRIQSISEDQQHRIWIGTRKGLYVLQGDRLTPYRLANDSTVPPVRNVTHAADGSIWCIASAYAAHIENGILHIYRDTPDHGFYGATAMLVDTGRVWFGTYGGGLFLIAGDSVIDVNRICPGFGPRVLAIHEDNRGYLWINAERELQRVRKADLLAMIADPSRPAFIDVYDHADGLTDLEFNMASAHSAQQLPDGRLLYASTSGIVAVTPEAVSHRKSPPPLTIERIIADDVEYDVAEQVVLPAGTRRIQIDYTAVLAQSHGRIQLRYRLGGIDKDWVYVQGTQRTATYTKTGPGDFPFALSASGNGGPWSSTPATITITVRPLLYEERWVQSLGAILFIAGVGSLWRWRTRRVLQRNRQLEAEVQRRVEAEAQMRSSLDEKTVMLKEIHHRVKNNMQIISSLFSLQLGSSRDPQVQEMLKESQIRIRSMALVHEALYRSSNLAAIDFREYVQGLAAQIAHAYRKQNVQLRFLGESVTLSLDQAIPAGLIMNESLSNAYKHAFPTDEHGTITVDSRSEGGTHVELAVSDDGPGLPEGFDPSTVPSLGFHLIIALTEQLGGTLTVEGKPGTTIRVKFPVE